jgi:NAD-dependent SIR2 family protein deacetylase
MATKDESGGEAVDVAVDVILEWIEEFLAETAEAEYTDTGEALALIESMRQRLHRARQNETRRTSS